MIEPEVMLKVNDEMLALSPADGTITSIDLTDRDGSPARKRQKVYNVERIITGADETINQAQQLLK